MEWVSCIPVCGGHLSTNIWMKMVWGKEFKSAYERAGSLQPAPSQEDTFRALEELSLE